MDEINLEILSSKYDDLNASKTIGDLERRLRIQGELLASQFLTLGRKDLHERVRGLLDGKEL